MFNSPFRKVFGDNFMAPDEEVIEGAPSDSLYINPQYEGGAASGPVAGLFPPNNHALAINTIDSAPTIPDVYGYRHWVINPLAELGQSLLSYPLFTNNPGLLPNRLYRYGVVLENASEAGTYIDLADVVGLRDIVIDGDGVAGLSRRLTIHFVVDAPVFAANILAGVGVAGASNAQCSLINPRLTLVADLTVYQDGDEITHNGEIVTHA